MPKQFVLDYCQFVPATFLVSTPPSVGRELLCLIQAVLSNQLIIQWPRFKGTVERPCKLRRRSRKMLSQQNKAERNRFPSFKTQPMHKPTTPKRSCGQVEIRTVTTLNIMRHSYGRDYIPDISAGLSDFKSTSIVQELI